MILSEIIKTSKAKARREYIAEKKITRIKHSDCECSSDFFMRECKGDPYNDCELFSATGLIGMWEDMPFDGGDIEGWMKENGFTAFFDRDGSGECCCAGEQLLGCDLLDDPDEMICLPAYRVKCVKPEGCGSFGGGVCVSLDKNAKCTQEMRDAE